MESKIKVNYNKNAKLTAQDILPEKLKEIEPGADRTACVKKLKFFEVKFQKRTEKVGWIKYILN